MLHYAAGWVGKPCRIELLLFLQKGPSSEWAINVTLLEFLPCLKGIEQNANKIIALLDFPDKLLCLDLGSLGIYLAMRYL